MTLLNCWYILTSSNPVASNTLNLWLVKSGRCFHHLMSDLLAFASEEQTNTANEIDSWTSVSTSVTSHKDTKKQLTLQSKRCDSTMLCINTDVLLLGSSCGHKWCSVHLNCGLVDRYMICQTPFQEPICCTHMQQVGAAFPLSPWIQWLSWLHLRALYMSGHYSVQYIWKHSNVSSSLYPKVKHSWLCDSTSLSNSPLSDWKATASNTSFNNFCTWANKMRTRPSRPSPSMDPCIILFVCLVYRQEATVFCWYCNAVIPVHVYPGPELLFWKSCKVAAGIWLPSVHSVSLSRQRWHSKQELPKYQQWCTDFKQGQVKYNLRVNSVAQLWLMGRSVGSIKWQFCCTFQRDMSPTLSKAQSQIL